MALKWLIGSVTQGSNDAYAIAEIATGLSNLARTAWRVRCVEWYVPALPGVDCNIQASLRRSSAAALGLLSQAVISGVWRAAEFTTSGMSYQANFPNVQLYSRDMDLLIVEETLYLDVDSATTSASNTVGIRVGVESRTITENERLTILANTANG